MERGAGGSVFTAVKTARYSLSTFFFFFFFFS